MNHLRQRWAALHKATIDYWMTQTVEDLYYEWEVFAWREIKSLNDRHQMWGKKWPVYTGHGDTYFAHEGIGYYGSLQTMLDVEGAMKRRGLPLPGRPALIGPKGEVYPANPGPEGEWEGKHKPDSDDDWEQDSDGDWRLR